MSCAIKSARKRVNINRGPADRTPAEEVEVNDGQSRRGGKRTNGDVYCLECGKRGIENLENMR